VRSAERFSPSKVKMISYAGYVKTAKLFVRMAYKKAKMLKRIRSFIYRLLGRCPICGGFMVKLPSGKMVCIDCKIDEMIKIYRRIR